MALLLLMTYDGCSVHKENELLAELILIPKDGVKVSIDLPYRGIAWRLSVALDGESDNADSKIIIELINESDGVLKFTPPNKTLFTRIDVGHKEQLWLGSLEDLRETPLSIPFSFSEPQNGNNRVRIMMLLSSSSPVRFKSGAGIVVSASSTDGL